MVKNILLPLETLIREGGGGIQLCRERIFAIIFFNEKDNFVGTAQCPKKHAKKRSHKIVIKENFGS